MPDMRVESCTAGSIKIDAIGEVDGALNRLVAWLQTIVDPRHRKLLANQLEQLVNENRETETANLAAHEQLRHDQIMNAFRETEAGIKLVNEVSDMHRRMLDSGLPAPIALDAVRAAFGQLAGLIQIQQTTSPILDMQLLPNEVRETP